MKHLQVCKRIGIPRVPLSIVVHAAIAICRWPRHSLRDASLAARMQDEVAKLDQEGKPSRALGMAVRRGVVEKFMQVREKF